MSLDFALLTRHDAPLEWGVNDCVQFAADAVQVYGGWRPELPRYASEREAVRVVAEGGGLEKLVAAAMPPPVPVALAQLGDVVLTAFGDTGPMLGVADPPGFWVRVARGGYMPLSLDLAVQVFPCRR